MSIGKIVGVGAAAACVAVLVGAAQPGAGQPAQGQPAQAQPGKNEPVAPKTEVKPDGAPRGITPQLIGEIAKAMGEMPGCLGVEVGQFRSGKLTIFGWFENKQRAMEWYNHPTHMKALGAVGYTHDPSRVPMADVPDDAGPIMALACARPFTPEEVQAGKGKPGEMQLGIELYSPLQGGYRFGAFSPSGVRDMMNARK
ncbi:MAG: hypothetical protein SFZ23_13845 [Planctomycetota bacterium]|nr:hypothetical protein [Planctomycetota bacterium]